jgi:hypothetical protein
VDVIPLFNLLTLISFFAKSQLKFKPIEISRWGKFLTNRNFFLNYIGERTAAQHYGEQMAASTRYSGSPQSQGK